MKKPPWELVEALCETVQRHRLFAPGETLVVAVSGGPDSTALLHGLVRIRPSWDLKLVAAHLNHGFRGEEAEAEADYVARLCARLEVPVHIASEDVPAMRRRRRLSAQEAARKARHDYLRRIAQEAGAEHIALGHTRDDRIETVLLNILRGTGLEGLSAMPPANPPLIRPLIDVGRAETEAYCVLHKLEPRRDSSNANLDYRRNRLRTELLPHLATYYNEKVGEAIARMADLVSADNALLETLASDELAAIRREGPENSIVLDGEAWAQRPLALRRRLLRQAILQMRGDLQGVGFESIERLIAAVDQRCRVTLELPCEGVALSLQFDGALIRIVRPVPAGSRLPWQVELTIPGRTLLPQAGMVVEAAVCAVASDFDREPERATPEISAAVTGTTAHFAVFALEAINPPLLARSWKPGDRMRPRGMGGSKKLQDLFTDAGISASERGCLPVVADAGGNGRILMVAGVRLSELALTREDCRNRENKDGALDTGLLLLRFSGS